MKHILLLLLLLASATTASAQQKKDTTATQAKPACCAGGHEEGEDCQDHGHEEEEVIVTATRASRSISQTPTRVEVISGEELQEKSNMKPGDIRMMLNESTGIQTQQTSATSFNAGIRIQGLEGRYTQLLRDGLPLYAGFSGGLSLLQITPLDLKQVEVIKGSASTLYGGGAIAGLVNLVSKTPGKNRELSFLANGTSAGGLDLAGFYSERYGKIGLTLYGAHNRQLPFDPASIGLTAIPKFERYTVHPRLFLYGKNSDLDLGVQLVSEDRIGGNMDYVKNGGSGFFERNQTQRISTQQQWRYRLGEEAFLQFRNSIGFFDRQLTMPGHAFLGQQWMTFSEATYNRNTAHSNWVLGASLNSDAFRQRAATPAAAQDYSIRTGGIFTQYTRNLNGRLTMEAGLRTDLVEQLGVEILPRLSLLYRLNEQWSTRIGGGRGYKSPTIFTEEAERRQFRALDRLRIGQLVNERSVGANWDINFKKRFGRLAVDVNQLFFYTRINNPLVLHAGLSGTGQFQTAPGWIDTRGLETNLRLLYGDFKLFFGYTLTDARYRYTPTDAGPLPLTARHRLNNVLMWEKHEQWKLGLEAYYFSPQGLTDGTQGRAYWITGFMGEKIWGKWSLFLNFENFSDTRQTKFGPIYTGSIDNPQFRDIYAPLDGFVMNGGFRIRL